MTTKRAFRYPFLLFLLSGCGDGGGAAQPGAAPPPAATAEESNAVLAAGSDCVPESVKETDPNTGWTWSTRWRCGNKGGATLYGDTYRTDAAAQTPTGTMKTTSSWFVCYRRGAVHAGGNNVWYYTKGDVAVSPYQRRSAWGYMPAVNVWTSIDPWPGIPQCPVGSSPPPRVNGLNKPIYFVHGYDIDGTGIDVNDYWGIAINDFKTDGDPARLSGTLGRPWTWCYYGNDRNCDLLSPGDRSVGIQELGKNLALEIYDHFSRFGDSVDVIAHSMGGLVIRAALTGVQNHEPGWPPYLYVEDVATLSTPHEGAPVTVLVGGLCGDADNQQCKDMRWSFDPASRSDFMNWVAENPQSAQGTDWTVIGFDDDWFIPAWSAYAQNATNRFTHAAAYLGDQFLPKLNAHMLPLWQTSGSYRLQFSDRGDGSTLNDRSSWYELDGDWDPIKLARQALFDQSAW
jgi:hypothetical protein